MAIPRVGPWPNGAINEFSSSFRGARVQPCIWQSVVLTADLPDPAGTGDYVPPIVGDLCYDQQSNTLKVFDGSWNNV